MKLCIKLEERLVDSMQPVPFEGFLNGDQLRSQHAQAVVFTSFIGGLFFKYQEPVMDQTFQVAFLPGIPAQQGP